jgi:hypothetical protein
METIPPEILHKITKGEIRTTLRINQVSKSLSKMINFENTTIMDFSSASDQFRFAYYTKLVELGVDIFSKQPSTRLDDLYEMVDKTVKENIKVLQYPSYNMHYPTSVLVSYYKRTKQGYVEPNDTKSLPTRRVKDYYKEIAVYDELIDIYLQICNFRKANMDDLIELRNLYFYKLYTIFKIMRCIPIEDQLKMSGIKENCAYIYYEFIKMCLTIALKKGTYKKTDCSRYLTNRFDYTLYYEKGMRGYLPPAPEMEIFNNYIYYAVYAQSKLDAYLKKLGDKKPALLNEEGALQKVIDYVKNHKTILIKSHKKIYF